MGRNVIVSVHATAAGIVDQFNTWTPTGVTFESTGRFDGRAVNLDAGSTSCTPSVQQLKASEDWTISLWNYKFGASNYDVILGNDGDSEYSLQNGDSFGINIIGMRVGGSGYALSGGNAPLKRWYHIAVVNSVTAGKSMMFVDGKLTSSTSNFTFKIAGPKLCLGAWGYSVKGTPGLVDDVSIVTGEARWTADFTPPTMNYLTVAKYGVMTGDGHLRSFTGGAWADLGTFADRSALMMAVHDQCADTPPSTADLLQLGGKLKACVYRSTSGDSTVTANGAPVGQFVHELIDVDLKGMSAVDWLKINAGTVDAVVGNGVLRVVLSRDSGKTWCSYSSTTSTWITLLDTTSVDDGVAVNGRFTPTATGLARLKSSGLTTDALASAPVSAWTLGEGFRTVRLGLYLELSATSDRALVDNVQLQYSGPGSWRLGINGTNYTVVTGNQSHRVTWLTGGKRVKVNY